MPDENPICIEATFFRKAVTADEKTKALHEMQDAETLARHEKTCRLKILRLANEAAVIEAGIKTAMIKEVLARKR